MVSEKVEKVDVSFLEFVPGRMRLMNQLRGKVTLCNIPSEELTPRAMMNSPESLSARSHSTVGSTRSRLRTSLGGQIRKGARGPMCPVTHTVDTINQIPTNEGVWWLKTRRNPVRWSGPLDDAGIAAKTSTCTSAYEGHSSLHFFYRGQRLACMQP